MALLTATAVACKCSPFVKRSRGTESVVQENAFCRKDVTDKDRRVCLFNSLAAPLIAALMAFSPLVITPVSLGQTIDIQKGASLFGTSCIGCHDAGGNIIQPGATLFTKDLERNGVNTIDEIYRVTYYGKGRMPGFGETCTPRGQCTFGPRLKDEDIKLLAEFVKLQADQGWVDISKYGD
ncbi:hypothetical protein QQ045_023666 [Rhodiola kirilowii]